MQIKRLFREIIRALSLTIDFDEGHRLSHARRVAVLAYRIARFMDRPNSGMLYYAGLLHDIGAMGLPAHITKYGPGMSIDPEARLHPGKGEMIIAPLAPLRPVAAIIGNHHEYYDGSGFSKGLKGDDISVETSIITMADLLEIELSTCKDSFEDMCDRIVALATRFSGTKCRPDVVEGLLSLHRSEPGLISSLFDEESLRQQVCSFDYSPPAVEEMSRIEMLNQLLWIFARIIDAKHSNTMGHSIRVTYYAYHIAKALSRDRINLWDVLWAGLLHDVGKVGVPRNLLDRPGPLTEQELSTVKRHSLDSMEIISSITDLAYLAYPAALHHERYDGLGYPFGKSGEDIPLLSRILMYANTYDALTSKRPYQKRLTHESAINLIKGGIGLQFDPNIADEAMEVLQKYGSNSMDLPESMSDFNDLFDINLLEMEDMEVEDFRKRGKVVESDHGILLVEVDQWNVATVSGDFTIVKGRECLARYLDGWCPDNFLDTIKDEERHRLAGIAGKLGAGETYTQFFFTKNGKYLEIILVNRGTSFDVFYRTAEHRLHSLKQTVLFFRNFMSSSEAVFFTDPDGIIFDVNQRFLDLYGYEMDEVVGKDPRTLIALHYGSEVHSKAWEHFRERRIDSWRGEVVTKKKDGADVIVSIAIDSIRDSSGRLTGFVGHALDISSRKRAQEELLKKDRQLEVKNAELERLNQLKNDLMAITSHDLKSPLSSMVNNAVLAKERLREGKVEKLERYLDSIAESGHMMARFIAEMLDLEKIDSGNFELNPGKVHLEEILRTCIDSNNPAALCKGVKIVADIQPDVHPVVADTTRMEQVFNNLLSNAVKFSGEGSTIEVSYSVENGGNAVVKICDQGPGIPEEDLETVFNRHYQVKKNRRAVGRSMGTGLGLYIVATIMELHQGSVRVENRTAGGCCFTVELPCGTTHEAVDYVVMIFDPARTIVKYLKGPLASKQVKSVVAGNIYEARRIYNYRWPGMIFVHYDSIGPEGLEFLRSTQSGERNRPIIACIRDTEAGETEDPLFSRIFVAPVLNTEVCEFLEEMLLDKARV